MAGVDPIKVIDHQYLLFISARTYQRPDQLCNYVVFINGISSVLQLCNKGRDVGIFSSRFGIPFLLYDFVVDFLSNRYHSFNTMSTFGT